MNDSVLRLTATVASRGPLFLLRAYQLLRLDNPEGRPADHVARLLAVHGVSSAAAAQHQAALRAAGIAVVTLLEPDYPAALRPLEDPPLVLFYRGTLEALRRPCIALVGSRACSDYGAAVARRFAADLAGYGVTVVSGLAHGIDGAAHQAVVAVAGRGVAVLGGGLNRVYPRRHHALAAQLVAAGGCVMSEFPPDAPPKPYHFPVRNRIISGLCRAVVVVEASLKSGSLITARHCLDQGRDLFAVPGPITHNEERGTHALIRNGEAMLLESPLQLPGVDGFAGCPKNSEGVTSKACFNDPLAKKIYEALDAFVPLPLDRIHAALDFEVEVGLVIAKLCELEAEKWVESCPGQCYLRNPLRNAV